MQKAIALKYLEKLETLVFIIEIRIFGSCHLNITTVINCKNDVYFKSSRVLSFMQIILKINL